MLRAASSIRLLPHRIGVASMKIRTNAWSCLLTASLAVPGVASAADWEFKLAPYLWFAGLEGDVATSPGEPSAPSMCLPRRPWKTRKRR